jgi:hypothetical protein
MSHFITTIEQLQDAGLSVDNDTDLDVLVPHLKDSENSFLRPVLGAALFDAAVAGLADETPDAKWTALLPYLQKPVAFNGYYRFFKISRGQLNHRGFMRDRSEYSETAPKWEIDEIKTQLICQADYALDQLIAFLEENADTYTEWESADFYEQNGGTIIPTSSIFDQYVKIGCSGRVFAKLKQYRTRAERALVRTICQDLYDKVVTEINGTMEAETTALLPYLRAVVAFDTMAKGIKMMNYNYLDTGIYVYSYSDGNITKTALTTNEVKTLSAEWEKDYLDARTELIDFLKDNLEDYPEYSSSKCYETQPVSLVSRYDNQITKKHWGL